MIFLTLKFQTSWICENVIMFNFCVLILFAIPYAYPHICHFNTMMLGHYMAPPENIAAVLEDQTIISCGESCASYPNCKAFNIHQAEKHCLLFTSYMTIDECVLDSEWDLYQITEQYCKLVQKGWFMYT